MSPGRARLGWLLVAGSALAAAGAFADTLRKGERLAGEPAAAGNLPGFTVTLPGAASALAASPDGRIATMIRQELVLLDANGAIRVRRPLPGPAKALTFGAAESVAAELAAGSSVLRYRDLFTRAWDPPEAERAGDAVAPAPLPTGGFVFARGHDVVVTDGEAHALRRLHLPDEYAITQLHVLAAAAPGPADPADGIYVFATHGNAQSRGGEDTALMHLGWGEQVSLRAVVRGKSTDRRLGRAGAELAQESGGLVHVSLAGAITRTDLPDDGYALTAFEHERCVAIAKAQLVVFRREAGRLSVSAPFGAPIARTDAGMVVPRVLVASAGAAEPLWILTADGTLFRSVAVGTRPMQNTRCDSSAPAFLVASAGRALVACQNRLIALGEAVEVAGADAGFRW